MGGPACSPTAVADASLVEAEPDTWHAPTLISQDGRKRSMRALVPPNRKAGSYLMVQMPEGDIRAEQLGENSIREGFHSFTYQLTDEDIMEHNMGGA